MREENREMIRVAILALAVLAFGCEKHTHTTRPAVTGNTVHHVHHDNGIAPAIAAAAIVGAASGPTVVNKTVVKKKVVHVHKRPAPQRARPTPRPVSRPSYRPSRSYTPSRRARR